MSQMLQAPNECVERLRSDLLMLALEPVYLDLRGLIPKAFLKQECVNVVVLHCDDSGLYRITIERKGEIDTRVL